LPDVRPPGRLDVLLARCSASGVRPRLAGPSALARHRPAAMGSGWWERQDAAGVPDAWIAGKTRTLVPWLLLVFFTDS